MPVSPKLPTTFFLNVDYQVARLSSNQMGKKSEYIFIKLSNTKNYKEYAKEMIFALKELRLWRYIDGTIVNLAPLSAKKKTITKAK